MFNDFNKTLPVHKEEDEKWVKYSYNISDIAKTIPLEKKLLEVLGGLSANAVFDITLLGKSNTRVATLFMNYVIELNIKDICIKSGCDYGKPLV